MEKIRVGAVSYLNTKPLLYGIERHPVSREIDLVTDYPARIAQMLIDNEIDVGLVPVAATLRLKEWHMASDFCIGTKGQVASVCLFSEVPMNEIEKVYLDYQSRTSVNLARILLKEYWNQNVNYIDAQGEDFRDQIKGTTAGVVIGDRALEQRLLSSFIYDLGEAWKNHTGLPFVFAAWISNKKLPDEFIKKFNEANAMGFDHLDEVIAENPFDAYDLGVYYRSCVRYQLDEQMIKGMNLFLKKLGGSSI